MVLWIAFAALAAAACLPLLFALRRPASAGAERSAVAIYKDQRGELEHDVERGVIQPDEAQAARTEIVRRLIKADGSPAERGRPHPGLRAAATVAVVAMPIAALALYLVLGSPNLADQPLAARLAAPAPTQDVAALV